MVWFGLVHASRFWEIWTFHLTPSIRYIQYYSYKIKTKLISLSTVFVVWTFIYIKFGTEKLYSCNRIWNKFQFSFSVSHGRFDSQYTIICGWWSNFLVAPKCPFRFLICVCVAMCQIDSILYFYSSFSFPHILSLNFHFYITLIYSFFHSNG